MFLLIILAYLLIGAWLFHSPESYTAGKIIWIVIGAWRMNAGHKSTAEDLEAQKRCDAENEAAYMVQQQEEDRQRWHEQHRK